MNEWLYVLIVVPIFCAWMYFLYRQGMITSKCIMAAVFLFRSGKNNYRIKLAACTGWIRHAGRFRENRIYEITLDAELTRGTVEVVLLDRQKEPLGKLNRQNPCLKIELDGKSRYYLRWEFDGATGTCELRW